MESIQPYLDYFGQHPGWAITLIFLIAFGEALLIIGLFVPSTAVLVGAGMLVGTGHLGFWEVFLATAVGAVLGDQISYWAGRLFGERLKLMWPLNRYPALVAKGEDFVRQHGGKSIAIGRFVPGVKAVVPGIVGMFGMGQIYFLVINVTSGVAWAAAHVFPGMLVGQMLAFAGELSERLLIVLLVLVGLLLVAGWLIRLTVGSMSPWIERMQLSISTWALRRQGRWWRRFGRAVSPENPGSIAIIVFAAVAITALLALIQLVIGVVAQNTLANMDVSIFNMMQNVRNAPADELMVAITMLGDGVVMLALVVAMIAWLLWRRAWRVAIAVGITFLAAKIFVPIMKLWLQTPRPVELYAFSEMFGFPSGHTTTATVTFGMLAVLASRSLGRWGKSVVYAACGIAIIAIAYSRLYLGAHWLSDVLGGFFFGAVMTAAFGIAIETIPPRRIMPAGLTIASLLVFFAVGLVHIDRSFAANVERYAEQNPITQYDLAQWQSGGWAKLPQRRIDLRGRSEEPFIAQWAGNTNSLAAALEANGWNREAPWDWRRGLLYLEPSSELVNLPPRPVLHEGLRADLTFTKPVPGNPGERLVIRVWKTDYQLAEGTLLQSISLVSLTRDKLKKAWSLYAIPSSTPVTDEEKQAIMKVLEAAQGARRVVVAASDKGASATALIQAMP
jgi:undecaprenyl-diphosphatase